jgi:hypothetical protein
MRYLDLQVFDNLKLNESSLHEILQRSLTLSEFVQSQKNSLEKAKLPKFNVTKTIKPDDECSICFNLLELGECNSCPECKNVIHVKCVQRWLSMTKVPSCIYCRSRIWKYYN